MDATTWPAYSLPSNRIELWFLMESQRLLRPAFRDFYKERDAQVADYRQQVETNPQGKLFGEFLATAFKVHPYRNPTGGWPGDIENLRRTAAKEYFDRYYSPGNITISIVGDVNPAEVKRMAERYFGPMTAKAPALPPHAVEPPQEGPRMVVLESTGASVVAVGYKRPDQYDKDDVVFDVIQFLLSNGTTGLLYRDMVMEKHLSVQARVAATFPGGRYPGLLAFVLVPAQGRSLEENQRGLEDFLNRFKTLNIEPQSLARAKAQIRTAFYQRAATGEGMAALLAVHQAQYGDWRKMFASIDELNKVTVEAIQRVADKYLVATSRTTVFTVAPRDTAEVFKPAKSEAPAGRPQDGRCSMRRYLCLLLLVPVAGLAQKPLTSLPGLAQPQAAPAAGRGGKAAAPSAAPAPPASTASAIPAPKDLKFPPARSAQMPAPTSFTLANGMKVYLQEDRELPLVRGTLVVRTGSLFDPPERIGLAQLTGKVLRSGGTTLKTGDQLDDMLESIGAGIESSIVENQGAVTFFALKESADTTLALLKELLMQPGFRQDKLEAARIQLRNAITHRNDSPAAIAARELRGLVYGKDTPYGWDQQLGTVDRITRGDVRSFYQRYYFPANMTLGIHGDFDSAQMKETLQRLFADWTTQQKPVPEFPKVTNAPSPGVFLAEKRDATEVFFAIGHLGGTFSDKDYAAMELVGSILGGPRGRLTERTRAKMGNPTDIRVNWGATPAHPGVFEITGSTRSISTLETIKAIQEEVERIRGAEVSEEELRLAREAEVARVTFEADTKHKLFGAMLGYEYYGYPKDFLQQHQKTLEAVTRADLLRAAKQYLVPANLAVVVSGNPLLLGDALDRLGPVTKLDITIPQAKAEMADSTDTSLAQGKQMLLKAQAAVGGGDRLAAVRDYVLVAQYQIDVSVQSMGGTKIVQTDRWLSPTTFRQESILPSGAVAAYTDWQNRLDLHAAGMGGARRHTGQAGVRRSLPRVLPPAAERPDGRAHRKRHRRNHDPDQRRNRPGGERRIRPEERTAAQGQL